MPFSGPSINRVKAARLLERLAINCFLALCAIGALSVLFGNHAPNVAQGVTSRTNFLGRITYVPDWAAKLRDTLFFMSFVTGMAGFLILPYPIKDRDPGPTWRRHRMLFWSAAIFFVTGWLAVIAEACVALAGNWRPETADSVFRYSHPFDSGVRYFSGAEHFILTISPPLSVIALLGFFMSVFVMGWLSFREYNPENS